MDALKETIRQERGFWTPETHCQLIVSSTTKGAIVGIVLASLFTGTAFGIGIGEGILIGQRFGTALKAGAQIVPVMFGVTAGSTAIPIIAALLIAGKWRPEEISKVRDAACEAVKDGLALTESDEISLIAKKALATVTPERLIRDLHQAVHIESKSIMRKSVIVRALTIGLRTGACLGYLVSACGVGYCLSRGLNPMHGLKGGAWLVPHPDCIEK
jgi:hypothetical protein